MVLFTDTDNSDCEMDINEALDFSLRSTAEEPKIKMEVDQEQDEKSPSQVPRTGKRLQRMRPADEKLKAIERIRGGESKASVARDINVPESTIRGWCKSETAIRRSLHLKSPYDSEAYFSSASSNGIAANSSDEENNHTNKKKFDAEILWNWLMLNQQMLNQQMMPLLPVGQMGDNRDAVAAAAGAIPLMNQNTMGMEKPKSADEAIAHGEKFLSWLEECQDPTVTRYKVVQLKQLLENLKIQLKK